jgi:Zn-dependent peptidase ImmA (M78 family)
MTVTDREAQKLRKKHTGDILPVDVEIIARGEGIRIESIPLDDALSGMSFIKDNISYIVVNKNHHINRRRFTIAHEIAHHILHKEYLMNNVHVDKSILRRESFSSSGIDNKEVQANSFAAELLMPEIEIKKLNKVDINDDTKVSELSKKLKVSTAALIYRLTNIGHTS